MSFVVKHKGKEKKIPFYKVGEIVLQTGNSVSTGALSSAGFWGIDVMVMSGSGRPVSVMKSLDDFSHVKTRLCQYEAFKTRRLDIAKRFVSGKLEGQKFNPVPDLSRVTSVKGLLGVEAKYSQLYFKRFLGLFPKFLRVDKREGYRAFDATNNLLNFGYEFLRWKVFRSLIKAKLEPYLGFLHGVQENRPSLVCDFQELYRCLIDDFIIRFSRRLEKKDFEKCYERTYYNKKSPRVYLKHKKTNFLVKQLSEYFESRVKGETMRKRGSSQTLETLISQECSLFAMFLRGEKSMWKPRVVVL